MPPMLTRLSAGNGTVDMLDDLADTELSTTGTPPVPNSSVTVMGDFGFGNVMVHWTSEPACSGTPIPDTGDLLMRDDEDMVTNTEMTMAVNVTSFTTAAQHLCITVDNTDDDEDTLHVRIPETVKYVARVSYKAEPNRVHAPMGTDNKLGMIDRDGTTIRLPYLTTNVKFRQRVRIVNRGPEAGYSMDFHGDGDVAGEVAVGTLGANSITNMNLGTEDVVTPGNGNNTSGTLIVEAGPGMIDVASVQINRELGTTDTVVYKAD